MYIEYSGHHSVYLKKYIYIIILFSALSISSRSISNCLCSIVTLLVFSKLIFTWASIIFCDINIW